MDSDQGPWPVLAGQATAGGKHLPVSCRPQAGRRPRPAETAALSEVALPLRRPDEPENRRDGGIAIRPESRLSSAAWSRAQPATARLPTVSAADAGWLYESPIRPWLAPNKLARAPRVVIIRASGHGGTSPRP